MRRVLLAGLTGLAIGVAAAGVRQQRTLTFEDRVAAQKAIEQVFWNHRIWPEVNAAPKPPLSAVLSDEAIRARVGDYLEQSNALGTWWQRPITDKQLQAELDRMAATSRDPQVLREIFAALGNDPYVIAETLARQTLADRLIRSWYANDGRFHADTRAKAEAALASCSSVPCMKSIGGEYQETTLRLAADAETTKRRAQAGVIDLDQDEWKQELERLAESLGTTVDGLRPNVWSRVAETTDGFAISALLSRKSGEITTASVVWPKQPFEAWWKSERARESSELTQGAATAFTAFTLPHLPDSGCVDDSWTPTMPDLVAARYHHTAVWTGTELIVWGGAANTGYTNGGGRYNPATDSWTATSTGANVPAPRGYHTAVWTGTEMIVWGGIGGLTNTGGRYNPVTDSWLPTSVGANVPSPRYRHTAVWTGTEMIVWGGSPGFNNNSSSNTGGRYDPSSDTWVPTSVGPSVPAPRYSHTATWTGTEMIVWGGGGSVAGNYLNDGGRYDPSTDTWIATSTGANDPVGRYAHTAVWTGSEMIVWGGNLSTDSSTNTGGRYSPSTDSWLPTSVGANVPPARYNHAGVWTGTELIVWGGSLFGGQYTNTGGRYNPASDAWIATSTGPSVPAGRDSPTAVWTGTEMIVYGGFNLAGPNKSGGRYDPSSDTWVATALDSAVPSARYNHTAVWTGTEMIVWGGRYNDALFNTGGRYRPSTDSWLSTSVGANVPSERIGHVAVWTGTVMIVWGGTASAYFNTGGRYNPSSDTWLPTSVGNAPVARSGPTAVWTGTEMIVWGGTVFDGTYHYTNTGGRYNPSTDLWNATSTGSNVPSARTGNSAIWTGALMVIWGGGSSLNDGARYNAFSNSWQPMSTLNAPSGRGGHSAIWTGSEMIVWGGGSSTVSSLNTGGRYKPSTDTWTATSTGTNVPAGRGSHAFAWTGNEMIIWGGWNGLYMDTGGRYNPSTDSWTPTSMGKNLPAARYVHTGVWSGSEFIVWAGWSNNGIANSGARYCACLAPHTYYLDFDGDGHGNASAPTVGSCGGYVPAGYVDNADDCNDANAAVYPNAPESNDGIDNQCPGDRGYGMIDELDDAGSVAPDKATFSWPAQSNASSYQMARATTPDFSTGCTSFSGPSPSFSDAETPEAGSTFYYIARAASPFVGSWGRTSAGVERAPACP